MGHFWPILGHLGPFRVTFWPSWVILDLDVALDHSRRVFFFFFGANIAFTRFLCRECRGYVLFGVEFWQKLAAGASDYKSPWKNQDLDCETNSQILCIIEGFNINWAQVSRVPLKQDILPTDENSIFFLSNTKETLNCPSLKKT